MGVTRYRPASASLLVGAMALALCVGSHAASPPQVGDEEMLIAAGDIAECPPSGYVGTGAEATARLVESLPGTVLALGDLAYPNGTEQQFRECYEPTWGRFKDRTRPVPGNHEYNSPGAAPYYAYWGERAGKAGEGFYSFDIGAWHIVALNSNLLGGALEAKQEEWLASDLKSRRTRCALAFFHHARFSSGWHASDRRLSPLLRILYAHGVDVVLTGHDHDYERFAPQDPAGHLDQQHGIRAFVVGTGGARLGIFLPLQDNSEVRIFGEHGVLRMTLKANGYRWQFLSAPDRRLLDEGRGECHRREG
jgi:3',5'-cyclic AMP phosphodiesterase CpdA